MQLSALSFLSCELHCVQQYLMLPCCWIISPENINQTELSQTSIFIASKTILVSANLTNFFLLPTLHLFSLNQFFLAFSDYMLIPELKKIYLKNSDNLLTLKFLGDDNRNLVLIFFLPK